MVKSIVRIKNDFFNYALTRLIFKNAFFLLAIRLFLLVFFIVALTYGFLNPSPRTFHFNVGIFWSLFWPFFMVVSLGTFGALFCGVCPHGFVGKYLTKYGLKRAMPLWMQNPLIGLGFLVFFYWLMLYLFPDMLKSPLAASAFFGAFSVVALLSFFLFKDMSYCKYLCPIGSITASFSKVSFTKLATYKEACLTCKGYECAKVCPYHLSPFNFDKNSSMKECKLCMECAHACEAVGFFIQKPASSLFTISKAGKMTEVWTYIIIACVASIAMILQNALGNSPIAGALPWRMAARAYEAHFGKNMVSIEGVVVLILATMLTFTCTVGVYKVASKWLNIPFKTIFLVAGYAIAPLVIFGGMAQTIPFFFTHYANEAINGVVLLLDPNATPWQAYVAKQAPWLRAFALMHFVGVFWGLKVLHVRVKQLGFLAYPWRVFMLLGAFHWLYLGLIVFVIGVFVFK